MLLKLIRLLALLAFLILGAGFAIINDAPVRVDLYLLTPELPLSFLLLLAVGLGIVLGGLGVVPFLLRVQRNNHDLRRQARLVREEVQNLRSMPLKGR